MLIPARNIPRIPDIPRGRTRATANRGMWGMGERNPVNDVVSSNAEKAKERAAM